MLFLLPLHYRLVYTHELSGEVVGVECLQGMLPSHDSCALYEFGVGEQQLHLVSDVFGTVGVCLKSERSSCFGQAANVARHYGASAQLCLHYGQAEAFVEGRVDEEAGIGVEAFELCVAHHLRPEEEVVEAVVSDVLAYYLLV